MTIITKTEDKNDESSIILQAYFIGIYLHSNDSKVDKFYFMVNAAINAKNKMAENKGYKY